MATIKRSLNKARNGRKRERKEVGKAATKISPPLKIFGLFLFLVLFLLVITTVLFYGGSNPSSNARLSEQLAKYSDLLRHELNLTEEVLFPLEVDPLAGIVKYHLHPIKDRIASIRTQVRGYESMSSKVPGGPTHFISTSLTELNDIRLNQFPKCDDEVLNVLSQRIRNDKLDSYNKLELKRNKNEWEQLMRETMYTLPAEGITFTPSSMGSRMDGNYEAEWQYYTSLPRSARESMANLVEVERVLRTLSGMFRQREGFEERISDLIRPHGYSGLTRKELQEFFQMLGDNQKNFLTETGIVGVVNEYNAVAVAIDGEIQKYKDKLEMTVVYFAQLIHRMNILGEKMENRAIHDDVYLRLRSDIMGDVDKLMKRVLALKS